MKKQQGEEIIYCYMKVICWGHKNATNKQSKKRRKKNMLFLNKKPRTAQM